MENLKSYEEFLNEYYCSPCVGCSEGHPSFWKTVIESPQWKEWKTYQKSKGVEYDFPECEELGIISSQHFQDFMNFIIEENKKFLKD